MRSLGIALSIAWISVGFDLLWLPPSQLDAEMSISRDFIESMETSPLKDSPAMQQGIEQAKRLLINQSRRGIILWIAWTALLVVVVYGLWSAYAVFRNGHSAFGYMLIGCFLFIGRQAIFHRASYQILFDGTNKLQRLLDAGHYEIVFSIVWHHYVLGIFFFSLATFSVLRLSSKRELSIGS